MSVVSTPQHAIDAVQAELPLVQKWAENLATHFEKVAIAKCAEIAGTYSKPAADAIRELLTGK